MSWRGEWLRRNGGSSCPVVIPQPVCARVSCTGTENGKGKVQTGPGKHRLCVAGLSLTVNLSGFFVLHLMQVRGESHPKMRGYLWL